METVTHTLKLQEPFYSCIENGTKTFEGRINRRKLEVGDNIEFVNGDRKLLRKIISLNTYSTFIDAIEKHGLSNVLPSHSQTSIEDAADDVYYRFFTKDEESRYGVIMIGIA